MSDVSELTPNPLLFDPEVSANVPALFPTKVFDPPGLMMKSMPFFFANTISLIAAPKLDEINFLHVHFLEESVHVFAHSPSVWLPGYKQGLLRAG